MDTENYNSIITNILDGIRMIQLNRPSKKNAFNPYIYQTLSNILNEDATNDSVVITLITGTGDYFSSGFDITGAATNMATNDFKTHLTQLKDMFNAFINYPKLLIALVNGPAIGVAVTTAALCDIIYATDVATFQTPFVKLGLCAEGCSSFTLPRLLGRSKASEMLLLGQTITAQEAYLFGLVAKVIPQQELYSFIGDLRKLGKLPVSSVKINKNLIMDNYRHLLYKCNDNELSQLESCITSDEFSLSLINFITRKSNKL